MVQRVLLHVVQRHYHVVPKAVFFPLHDGRSQIKIEGFMQTQSGEANGTPGIAERAVCSVPMYEVVKENSAARD